MLIRFPFPLRNADGTGTAPATVGQTAEQINAPQVGESKPVVVANPAAQIVVTGTKTEAEIKLTEELESTKGRLATTEAEKKAREIEVNELQDRLRTLTEAKPKPAAKEKFSWMGFGAQ